MEQTISPTDLLIASSDAIASDVDGEIVLISVESGRYFGLDAVGSEIWRRLRTPICLKDLCAGLQSDFEGDPATIEQEAHAFVTKLAARGLVKVSGR